MTSKILLIENDPAFAARLTEALEASGFDVRTTGDGKEGLELAGDIRPDAIVLSVELPRMSGYMICAKLKKDESLRNIPVVLTSSEATPETFEKHRELKGRAEDYLLKPFEPAELVARLGALLGVPTPAPVSLDDEEEGEVLTLEDDLPAEEVAPEDFDALPGIAALDLDALPDEPAAPSGIEDDALKLLDDAFDEIAIERDETLSRPLPPPPSREHEPLDPAELEAAVDDLPGLGASFDDLPSEEPGPDAEEAIDALGFEEAEEIDPAFNLAPEPPAAPAAAASALPSPGAPAGNARELESLRAELAAANARLRASEEALRTAREEAAAAEERARTAEERARAAEDARQAAEGRARTAEERVRAVEERLRTADERVSDLSAQLADARERADAAEAEVRRLAESGSRAEELERELDDLRTELVVARGEAEGARAEIERKTADLQKRVAELEAQNAKNEERVLKAYQKIKGDERVREKARKAVAIALQLLDDSGAADAGAEARAKIAAALGRE